MLEQTLARAGRLVPPERIVVVVAEQHRRWWNQALSKLAEHGNVIVQPRNRGTAAGLLLGSLRVLAKGGVTATLLAMPSDHYVRTEGPLLEAVLEAIPETRPPRERLVLLGMEPEEDDSEYGWILPGPTEHHGIREVASFVEKPDAAMAHALRLRGALVNSLIFLTANVTLLDLFEAALPALLRSFVLWAHESKHGTRDGKSLRALYEDLPTRDFSRDVLQVETKRLSVVRVAPCGWLDVGTPSRLSRFLDIQARQHTQTRSFNAAEPGTMPAGG